ncbi:MAG: excinuclease ABC subunit UvrC [Acidimicrobiales bacterium]|nr:excinuclease ABC subunit UvrC [Acidimicrobiales bacterium]
MVQRPPAGTIPDAPGSYQFKDVHGRVIYVGKAKSLRQRLSNYFQNPRNMHARTAQMVATAETVEWIQVRNDVEALMLEYNLIKRHQPRFNVRLRDDKSYPFLAVTVSDEWPRPMVMRGKKKKGVQYFGPYANAYAIRETLDLLLRTFPLRTCSNNKFESHQKLGRPCLLFHIEKCSGPCVGEVESEDYQHMTKELLDFLDGETDAVVERMEADMASAASELEFEKAARLRDQLTSVRKAIAKQQMVGDRSEDLDVLGIAEDDLEAAVQVFFVRKGRVVGRKGFIVDKVEELTPGQLLEHVLEGLYDDPPLGIPKQVLVPTMPDDPALYEEYLTELRGSRVEIKVPQRGEKVRLQETVTSNAKEAFTRHRLKRASDHNSRARALNELQEHLGLPEAPLRIECYDMSHLQGSDYVGSMVVTEDGLPKKSEYRRFKIKEVEGNDDFAAMEEVLRRRLTAYLSERRKPVGERPNKFAYPPQLLLVDGGKGQLTSAIKVLDELGLRDEIPVASLAKQFEEVFVPGRADAIRIPRQSEALYLLQRLRDESHRFAITYHRQLRDKRMTKSSLDDVPGLGPVRRKRLVKELGSVKKVKAATIDELQALSWLPDDVAQNLWDHVHRPGR